MVLSSAEEESLETPGGENSKASIASASTSGNGSDAGEGNVASTDQVELNSIEQLEDGGIEDEDDEGIKSEENGDIAAEKEPLRPKEKEPVPSTSTADNIVGDEEEVISKDDLDSDEVGIRKKGWDLRCIVVGILILVIMIGGATAAILVHRFKGQCDGYLDSHLIF